MSRKWYEDRVIFKVIGRGFCFNLDVRGQRGVFWESDEVIIEKLGGITQKRGGVVLDGRNSMCEQLQKDCGVKVELKEV